MMYCSNLRCHSNHITINTSCLNQVGQENYIYLYTMVPERSTVTLWSWTSHRVPHRHLTKIVHRISSCCPIYWASWRRYGWPIKWIPWCVGRIWCTLVEAYWASGWATLGHTEWSTHGIDRGWKYIIINCRSYNTKRYLYCWIWSTTITRSYVPERFQCFCMVSLASRQYAMSPPNPATPLSRCQALSTPLDCTYGHHLIH